MTTEVPSSREARRALVIRAGMVLAIVIAAPWLSYQLWRLTLQPVPLGAVDLMLRHQEVRAWFAGEAVYQQLSNAMYPPASYLLLGPLGWLPLATARWVWAGALMLFLAGLAALFARCCPGDGGVEGGVRERRFLLCVPLALYPVGATVGNGQLGILVTLCLATTFWLLSSPHSRRVDLAVTGLFLVALIKPSLAAFFFWVVIFAHGGWLRAALVVAGYALLTWASSAFQPQNAVELLSEWFTRGSVGSRWGALHGEGSIRMASATSAEPALQLVHLNLHSLLGALGHKGLMAPATFLLLLALGAWVFLHRRNSVWILAGVTAIVARFGAYHAWYDDVVLLLPMIALYRLGTGGGRSRASRAIAGGLFAGMFLSLLAPGGIYLLPHPWSNVYVIAQAVLWIITLAFLVTVAWRSRTEAPASPGS